MDHPLARPAAPAIPGTGAADPVLLAARILLWILLAGIALTFFFEALASVVSLPFTARGEWRAACGQGLTLAALGTAAGMAWRVLAIIDSVGRGQAFAPANAAHIERLGLGLLGLQGIAMLAAILRWPIGGDVNGFDITLRPGLGGIAMALLLFVLARVFRLGTRMRDDLEGTV